MKLQRFLSAVGLLVLATCGDGGPAPGAGGALPSGVTAAELGAAVWTSIDPSYSSLRLSQLVAREVGRTRLRQALDLGLEDRLLAATQPSPPATRQCSRGGSVSSTLTRSEKEINVQVAFADCQVTLQLGETAYRETISGMASAVLTITSGEIYTAVNTTAMSLSGDLGFAASCQLTATAVNSVHFTEASTFSGSCKFYDNSGQTIAGTAQELKELMFVGVKG